MRLRDLSKPLSRFRDSTKIFRDPRFSRYHSTPLILQVKPFIVTIFDIAQGVRWNSTLPTSGNLVTSWSESRLLYHWGKIVKIERSTVIINYNFNNWWSLIAIRTTEFQKWYTSVEIKTYNPSNIYARMRLVKRGQVTEYDPAKTEE